MMRSLENNKLPLLESLRIFPCRYISWTDIYLPGFIMGVLVGYLWAGLQLKIGILALGFMSSTDYPWQGVSLLCIWLLTTLLARRLFGELRSVWLRRGSCSKSGYHGLQQQPEVVPIDK